MLIFLILSCDMSDLARNLEVLQIFHIILIATVEEEMMVVVAMNQELEQSVETYCMYSNCSTEKIAAVNWVAALAVRVE